MDLLELKAVLFYHGIICVKVERAFEDIYHSEISLVPGVPQPMTHATVVWSNWRKLVEENMLSTEEIRIMLWIRSLPKFGEVVKGAFCPLCKRPVHCWLVHFQGMCSHFVVAVVFGFRQVLEKLRLCHWTFQESSIWTAQGHDGSCNILFQVMFDGRMPVPSSSQPLLRFTLRVCCVWKACPHPVKYLLPHRYAPNWPVYM